MSKAIKTWPRESVHLKGATATALLGYATSVMLDGVEAIIAAPTMAGLEKVYDEILRLDDEGTMKPFDADMCTHVAYMPRTAVDVDLDL